MAMPAEKLLHPTPRGLYCPVGDFYVDPVRAVERAVVTHGHADHARAGHGAVLATPETLAIMAVRYGENFTDARQPARYGEALTINNVRVKMVPAGHVLGSAQVVIEHEGTRIVVSGDYKRRRDPTCPGFEAVACDVFVTEATFALPVFRHPPTEGETRKLLNSLKVFPERTHLVGAYALGKAQRVIGHLREDGYDQPIYLHGAMEKLCALYQDFGVDLGDLRMVRDHSMEEMTGQVVIAPPSAMQDKWSRRFAEPVTAFASGWMRIRARARQSGVELPLIISDHADWDELTDTIAEIQPAQLWVTHGREDALVHAATQMGIAARSLNLVGYDDGGDGEDTTPPTPSRADA